MDCAVASMGSFMIATGQHHYPNYVGSVPALQYCYMHTHSHGMYGWMDGEATLTVHTHVRGMYVDSMIGDLAVG